MHGRSIAQSCPARAASRRQAAVPTARPLRLTSTPSGWERLIGKRTSGEIGDPGFQPPWYGNFAAYSSCPFEGAAKPRRWERGGSKAEPQIACVTIPIVRFLPRPRCFHAALGALARPRRAYTGTLLVCMGLASGLYASPTPLTVSANNGGPDNMPHSCAPGGWRPLGGSPCGRGYEGTTMNTGFLASWHRNKQARGIHRW